MGENSNAGRSGAAKENVGRHGFAPDGFVRGPETDGERDCDSREEAPSAARLRGREQARAALGQPPGDKRNERIGAVETERYVGWLHHDLRTAGRRSSFPLSLSSSSSLSRPDIRWTAAPNLRVCVERSARAARVCVASSAR